jgi:hypothetical protein
MMKGRIRARKKSGEKKRAGKKRNGRDPTNRSESSLLNNFYLTG